MESQLANSCRRPTSAERLSSASTEPVPRSRVGVITKPNIDDNDPQSRLESLRESRSAFRKIHEGRQALTGVGVTQTLAMIGEWSLSRGYPIKTCVLSPDGHQILTTSEWDGLARLWRINSDFTLTLLKIINFHNNRRIDGAHFSPDGTKILTYCSINSRLWQINSDHSLTELALMKGTPASGSSGFSPDGSKIILRGQGSSLAIWQVNSNNSVTLLDELPIGGGPIIVARFSPDSRKILAVMADSTVRVWGITDFNTIRRSGTLGGFGTIATQYCDFSPDSSKIMIPTRGVAQVWQINQNYTATFLATFKTNYPHGDFACFTPDSTKVLMSAGPRSAKIWQINPDETRSSFTTIDNLPGKLKKASFSPDGSLVIATFGDSGSSSVLQHFQDHTLRTLVDFGEVRTAEFSHDGTQIQIFTRGMVQLWEDVGQKNAEEKAKGFEEFLLESGRIALDDTSLRALFSNLVDCERSIFLKPALQCAQIRGPWLWWAAELSSLALEDALIKIHDVLKEVDSKDSRNLLWLSAVDYLVFGRASGQVITEEEVKIPGTLVSKTKECLTCMNDYSPPPWHWPDPTMDQSCPGCIEQAIRSRSTAYSRLQLRYQDLNQLGFAPHDISKFLRSVITLKLKKATPDNMRYIECRTETCVGGFFIKSDATEANCIVCDLHHELNVGPGGYEIRLLRDLLVSLKASNVTGGIGMTRESYCCGIPVTKEKGCAHMTCPTCLPNIRDWNFVHGTKPAISSFRRDSGEPDEESVPRQQFIPLKPGPLAHIGLFGDLDKYHEIAGTTGPHVIDCYLEKVEVFLEELTKYKLGEPNIFSAPPIPPPPSIAPLGGAASADLVPSGLSSSPPILMPREQDWVRIGEGDDAVTGEVIDVGTEQGIRLRIAATGYIQNFPVDQAWQYL